MKMDIEDILIALIDCEDEKNDWLVSIGRTIIQKKIYFLNELLNLGIQYKPYFYGPYSEEVSQALSAQIATNFIQECADSYPANNIWGEGKKYNYKLTEDGKKVFENLKKEKLDEFLRIKEIIEKINSMKNISEDYNILSRAAKIHHIVKIKGKISLNDIKEEIKRYDWKDFEISNDIISFLEKLGLVKPVCSV